MLELLFEIGLVGSWSKLICIVEFHSLDHSQLCWWKSRWIDSIWILKKLMFLRVYFNVLPAVSLPTAGNQVHSLWLWLLLVVIILSITTVKTVAEYWLAMSWSRIILFLNVGLNLRASRIGWKFLHILCEILVCIRLAACSLCSFWKDLQAIFH